MSRTIKNLIGEAYRPIEERMMEVIWKKFGIKTHWHDPRVKAIDNMMLATEMRDLMYFTDIPFKPDMAKLIPNEQYYQVRDSFMEKFNYEMERNEKLNRQ